VIRLFYERSNRIKVSPNDIENQDNQHEYEKVRNDNKIG